MAMVTAAIHSFLYFFVYLGAFPVVGGLMFVLLGIPLVGLHVLVWAAARFAGAWWALVCALLANCAYALVGLLWPSPIPGSGPSAAWFSNALVFIAIGMATTGLLIAYTRFAHRQFVAPKGAPDH